MDSIFISEEQNILKSEAILELYDDSIPASSYRELREKYKKLLKQVSKIVKMAVITQLELKNMSERLEKISNMDVLTGLYNRRFFNLNYVREWTSSIRTSSTLSCIMIDIDYFKKYNDTYGHLQGDECLKLIAEAIQTSAKRPRDIVARFGGEEFVILLPETNEEGAMFVANEVLTNVMKLKLEHKTSNEGIVTVSLGVVTLKPNKETDSSVLLNMADEALYQAKRNGRNRIEIASVILHIQDSVER